MRVEVPAGDLRDATSDQRDTDASVRDAVAGLRDERDGLAGERDVHADQRDAAARERDRVGDQRDRVAFLRDHRADERDDLANARDRAAELADAGPQQWRESARRHGAERRLAAADRSSASQDRLDVDHLKAVNDEGGHLAGDRMLVQVATALKAQLRAHDLVIRVGGDEFVCVVAGLDRPVVAARLARVNDALSASTPPGSVSVGLAELRPGDTSESLVERADAELYRGRRAARSTSDADPLDPAV